MAELVMPFLFKSKAISAALVQWSSGYPKSLHLLLCYSDGSDGIENDHILCYSKFSLFQFLPCVSPKVVIS